MRMQCNATEVAGALHAVLTSHMNVHKIRQCINMVLQAVPHPTNRDGSALTMWSVNGLEFGGIFFASCFGWIWADQGFWQSAIAARPSAAFK